MKRFVITPGLRALGVVVAVGLFAPTAAHAEEANVQVGDPINGRKLYVKNCAVCHGDDGTGGRSAVPLTAAARLNLLRDDQLFAMVRTGKSLKKPAKHAFKDKLKFLEIWDTIAYTRTLHMTLDAFFPESSRYISKVYEIDDNGLKRLKASTGSRPSETKAAVFTFFDFENEKGALTYVPQDPIMLDKLKKDKKAGYLVFLPFETAGFAGREVGIAMDSRGVITKVAVHDALKGSADLNRSLGVLTGQGRLGQKKPFKVKGTKKKRTLASSVFPLYQRAMETVTQYVVEERERTWADDAVQ